MIGRDTSKATFAATGVLSLGLFLPASLTFSGTHIGTLTVDGHSSAYVTRAASVGALLKEHGVVVHTKDRAFPDSTTDLRDTNAVNVRHAFNVQFTHNGATESIATASTTIAEFLNEQNIHVTDDDYVYPDRQTALAPDMSIEYRPAIDVTLLLGKTRRTIHTAEASVSTLLYQQGITLGPRDFTIPALRTPLADAMKVRVVRVIAWKKTERQNIAPAIERRLDFKLTPGQVRVVAQGNDGVRERVIQYTQRDDERPQARVLAARIIRAPKARIIAAGIGEFAAFSQLAARGFTGTLTLARSALSMVATAYTAGCSGCSGITAIGRPAGHGIVAVDPRVIPLGTRLYIPGYGLALAGDTGGAIRGNRIDLGFNSYSDAIRFGRRPIAVYVLH